LSCYTFEDEIFACECAGFIETGDINTTGIGDTERFGTVDGVFGEGGEGSVYCKGKFHG
jgi:hypothetical protein